MSKGNFVIEHRGTVELIEEDKLWVSITQMSACSACHARSACGAADMSEKQIEAIYDDPTIKVGDNVMVYGQRKLGLKAVFWAFVLPFCVLLLTLLLLQHTQLNEGLSGTISLATLIPYYGILSLFKDKLKQRFVFHAYRIDEP